MKVGLILSGFLRTYKEAFSLLQKNVFDRYDTDLYLATWNKNENGTFIEDFEKIGGVEQYLEKNIQEIKDSTVYQMYYWLSSKDAIKKYEMYTVQVSLPKDSELSHYLKHLNKKKRYE